MCANKVYSVHFWFHVDFNVKVQGTHWALFLDHYIFIKSNTKCEILPSQITGRNSQLVHLNDQNWKKERIKTKTENIGFNKI